ncbi:MAG TPA: hypothetical protein VFT56_05700 [Sphingomonas sp.]|nr:hypothetical protein [Sphingomonas sp.]
MDAFSNSADSVSAPATRAAAVAPNDAAPLADIPKALFVGVGGDVVVQGAGGGADALFRNVPSGAILPIRARFVRATGTTASGLVALY